MMFKNKNKFKEIEKIEKVLLDYGLVTKTKTDNKKAEREAKLIKKAEREAKSNE